MSQFNKRQIIVEDIRSKNMFDKNAARQGALNADGTIDAMEGIYTSDFIAVDSNKTYYKGQTDSARFKFYDTNKTALSSTYADIQSAGNAQAFTVPSNAHYIRFSVTQEYLSTLQVEEGTQATEYCKHFDFNTIEEVIENSNGTAIKYSNGIMICCGNKTYRNLNFNTLYGNVYTNSEGFFNITYAETFKDIFEVNLSIQSFSGGIGGISGTGVQKDKAYFYLWHATEYILSVTVGYTAIGHWK